MILLQYLLFIKFSNLPDESDEQKQMNAKYTLPLVSARSSTLDLIHSVTVSIVEHQADRTKSEHNNTQSRGKQLRAASE